MIVLRDLCKTYVVQGVPHVTANRINAVFPSRKSVALLGRNGAGKSSLLRMIAGTMNPTSGTVTSTGSISWPVGFAGSFHGDLSGAQNAKFIARIYGVDTDSLTEFVQDFAELGKHFHLPLRTYSSGMRARLAFGVSMGIKFDTYLVDEVTSVGDAAFRSKSETLFQDRMQNSGAVVVSHSMDLLRRVCTSGAVLEDGRLEMFEDIDDAIAQHQENMRVLA
jgi:capsular polysaccharide transport system ATP-binding protein